MTPTPTIPENFLPCHYCGQTPAEQGRYIHPVSRDENGEIIACCKSPACVEANQNERVTGAPPPAMPKITPPLRRRAKRRVAKWRFGVDRIDAVALREVFDQHGDELLLERDGDYITLFVYASAPAVSPEEREEQAAKVCRVCGAYGTYFYSRGGGEPGDCYYCQTPGCANYDKPIRAAGGGG